MIIYVIANAVNGKLYVGQTTQTIEMRWKQHLSKDRRCAAISNAINKYGPDKFFIFEIARCRTLEELNVLEESIIADLNTVAPNGYNLRSGGLNKKHSELSKKKMSEIQKKLYSSKYKDGVYPNSGKKRTAEQRQHLSRVHTGKKQTPEQIEKRRLKLFKPVECITNGVTYESMGAAAEALNINRDTVTQLIKNPNARRGYPHCGLEFRFVKRK